MARRPRLSGHQAEDHRTRSIDDLAEFEDFRTTVLADLRRDVLAGKSPEEIRKKWANRLTAEQITIAMTDENSSTRLAAIKDITDRAEGKPKETKEISHRLGKLPEEQIDSLLYSEFQTLSTDELDSE